MIEDQRLWRVIGDIAREEGRKKERKTTAADVGANFKEGRREARGG